MIWWFILCGVAAFVIDWPFRSTRGRRPRVAANENKQIVTVRKPKGPTLSTQFKHRGHFHNRYWTSGNNNSMGWRRGWRP